jgi:two-component system sensor kinase FixL
MLENLQHWLSPKAFMPHGACLVWNPGLIQLHVVSDALIALSYYSIPFGLAYFARRRTDLVYRWMFQLFAAFILACGTTHLFDILILWYPAYAAQGLIKAVTAAISLSGAVLLWPVVRHALVLPSPSQLAAVNARLSLEAASHRRSVERLEAEAAERRQLEEKLKRNEARLRTILDTAVEGIVTIDGRGVIEMCNPAAARMFGYSAEELLGQPIARLMPPPQRDAHDGYLARSRIGGDGRALFSGRELTGLRKDGSTFPVEVAVGSFESGGRHFTGILRDITERKALEERLQRQQAELIHAQRLTTAGELAATMAHELNQPLGAIANYLGGAILRFREVLEAHPSLGDAINETLRLSKRAAEIVYGIRDLVRRHESGREWLTVDAIVTAALALARPELARRNIKVVRKILPGLPPIWGQRVHLQQLLLNLMLNAMEAMESADPGGRELTLYGTGEAGGAAVEIGVGDTGGGVAPDLEAMIFEPFVTTKSEGMGLGLSICRTIVEAHGGRIAAAAAGGGGALFTVSLPTGGENSHGR